MHFFLSISIFTYRLLIIEVTLFNLTKIQHKSVLALRWYKCVGVKLRPFRQTMLKTVYIHSWFLHLNNTEMLTFDSQKPSYVQVLYSLLVYPAVHFKLQWELYPVCTELWWDDVHQSLLLLYKFHVISSIYDRCTLVSLYCLCGNQQCGAFLSGRKRQVGVVVMLIQSIRQIRRRFIRIFRLLCDIRASLAVRCLLFLTYRCVIFDWLHKDLFATL